jgi:hypothetical protein
MKNLKLIPLVIAIALLGEVKNVSGQCTFTDSYNPIIDCPIPGGLCSNTFDVAVQTTGSLFVQYTTPVSHCSNVIMHFILDGQEVAVSGILAPTATTGFIDLSPVTAGPHLLQLRCDNYTNGCYVSGDFYNWGGQVDVTISSTLPTTPSNIITSGGSVKVCPNETRDYTTALVSGVTYLWTVPTGATINSGQGTNSINVTYDANFTTTGIISVVKVNGCGSSAPRNLTISRNNPTATITTNGGATTFCSGTNPLILNANAGAGFTYQWKKGSTNILGATNQSYVPTTTSTSYKVVVTNTQGCSKTSAAIGVTVNPLPSATITAQGSTTFCAGDSVVLEANSGTGLTYQWKKGVNNISGASNLNYTAKTAGTYKVIVTNANSCSKTSSGKVVSVNCRLSISGNEEKGFELFPNPTNGIVTLKFNSEVNQNSDLIVADITGRDVINEIVTLSKGENEFNFDMSNLVKGIYLVKLKTLNTENAYRIVKE